MVFFYYFSCFNISALNQCTLFYPTKIESMTSLKFFFISIMLLLSTPVFSQDFQILFRECVEKKDTAAMSALLLKWEKQAPDDPELMIAWFNYYVNKSRQEMVEIENVKNGNQSIPFSDSTGKTVGYVNTTVEFMPSTLEKGYSYIDKGIAAHPSRLDMRFGKIYMLGQTESYSRFTEEIIKTVAYSDVIKNAWLWTGNIPMENAQKSMLQGIQGYVNVLYNKKDNSLNDYIRQISESILKYYPGHVESLSNLAFVFIMQKKYNKALDLLLKAEKIAPKDYLIMGNIANTYKLKGDKEKAKIYYEKILVSGDAKAKEAARQELEKLK
jgi:tetratricopeptide (TPR) repeat protein